MSAASVLTTGPTSLPSELWLLALSEVHRAAGWLHHHAAVVRAGEHALGITGVSGAGKSTAALRLVNEGFDLLSEDQAWVRATDGLSTGFDHHLRALPDTLAKFALHLVEKTAGLDQHGKHLLPVLHPGQMGQSSQLLVFGLPLDAPKALQIRAVWESVSVPLTPAGRQATAAGISALLRRVQVQAVTRDTGLPSVLSHAGRQ